MANLETDERKEAHQVITKYPPPIKKVTFVFMEIDKIQ